MEMDLKSYSDAFDKTCRRLKDDRVLERIWDRDYTVWRPDSDEIANRLGWLDIADRLQNRIGALREFASQAHDEGFTNVLLLGMGGSSLAPEVLRKTYGVAMGGLELDILDSTDPGAIRAQMERLDPGKTLFIVATKSGGTVETLSFFKHFYNWVAAAAKGDIPGAQFIAITDPGSRLETIASEFRFRRIFLNDPNIGGRYSALSYFGLVPAALLGVDLEQLLERAIAAAESSRAGDEAALQLGAALGELAAQGRDKLTFFISPEIAGFGDWVEQLIAESTGKEGRGILPVVGEESGEPGDYGGDRVFVEIALASETRTLLPESSLHPLIRIRIHDIYDLGEQFFLWELATAVAGHVMGIQPFDQPNVEAAKILARDMVASYHEIGRLPNAETANWSADSLEAFLADMADGEYIVIQAYVTPSAEVDSALQALRTTLRRRTKAAVTAAYGPRFLHSTGQLHKGDGGRGRFIQFTSGAALDVDIPDEAGSVDSKMSFQVLKLAQALGDFKALESAEPPRKVIHFHLETGVAGALRDLSGALAA